ncbi:glycosyltransferase family 4 protein [Bordetella sp. 2513F-2]
MRVGFGTTILARGLAHGGVDGIGSYTRELGSALLAQPGLSLLSVGHRLFCHDDALPGIDAGVDLGWYPPRAALCAFSPLRWPEERHLAGKVDLYHATDHLVPKFSRIPVVATVMDAIPLSHPQWIRTQLAGPKRWLWRRACRWADHVVTISEYSKTEIIRHFGIEAGRISVIPLGVHPRFFEPIDAASREAVLQRLGLPNRFFLFVGTLQPRKNLERVLDAHASLPAGLQRDMPLVMVGRSGWGCDALVARMEDAQAGAHVRWLQYLPDAEVRALMQSAAALVFPSLCEGFGLPVVEAFASGLPVITSNTTSLPEVAGDAALLVDPQSAGEISQAMRALAGDDALAARLRSAGLARARELTWQACAAGTRAVYEQVLR